MNLYDFVDHIPNRILDRGYEYWLDGRVVVESERESTYYLTAEGSETYELLITLSGIDIVDSSCDCPYTKGHCKHEVAAYFLLREKVAAPSNRNVRQQLQKLTKQQLVNLIVGLANDPELYPRIARSFDTSHKSFTQVIKEMRRRFSEKFPMFELDYTSLSSFQSFVDARVSDVLIVQDHEMRLKQGIALMLGMSDYDFEELSEMSLETANELDSAICSAINMLSNDVVYLELLDVLKSVDTWNWTDLHLEILKSLTFEMKDGLDVLRTYIETYRETEADDYEVEELEVLLRIIEKRRDS